MKAVEHRRIQAAPGQVSLTAGMWTSVSGVSYMAVTALYIDKEWTLQQDVLAFVNGPYPHAWPTMAAQVRTIIADARLTGKAQAAQRFDDIAVQHEQSIKLKKDEADIHNVLNPLADAINMTSGQTYVTSPAAVPIVSGPVYLLRQLLDTPVSEEVKRFASAAALKLVEANTVRIDKAGHRALAEPHRARASISFRTAWSNRADVPKPAQLPWDRGRRRARRTRSSSNME
ncbi:hypothetical protein RI367_000746 [Sorochytrium milnesiophthora]